MIFVIAPVTCSPCHSTFNPPIHNIHHKAKSIDECKIMCLLAFVKYDRKGTLISMKHGRTTSRSFSGHFSNMLHCSANCHKCCEYQLIKSWETNGIWK